MPTHQKDGFRNACLTSEFPCGMVWSCPPTSICRPRGWALAGRSATDSLRQHLGAGLQYWPQIAASYVAHGYAFVSQDVRGRGDSDGKWEPFVNEGPRRIRHHRVGGRQPWCDGKVGFMGVSYGGFVQWAAARERPPHLTAMVSTAAPGRWMEEIPYRFGIFRP